FDFGVGSHHGELAPEKNREHSIKLQLPAWNVGFMRRLRSILGHPEKFRNSGTFKAFTHDLAMFGSEAFSKSRDD
ncbi:hypothetical protein, partial [Pseudomonas syringae]|uniref:hypothetical protein n=1 Tax=Pseudomonas syringae TaxID=317 RepID=UPI001CA4E3AA